MQHTIKLDAVTCEKINAMKEAKASYSEAADKVKSINDSILLPSGRARKGGRKELEEAKVESRIKYETYNKAKDVARQSVRTYVNDIRSKHINDVLSRLVGQLSTAHEFEILMACIESIKSDGSKVKVNIEHTVYDVRAVYESYNGFRVSINFENEYCGIGGGAIEIKKQYERSDFEDKKQIGISGSLVDGFLVIEIPDDYLDNVHKLTINHQREIDSKLARSFGEAVVACSVIQENLNKNLKCDGINGLTSSIFYSI
jgi:hypothetical protein